MSGSTPTPLITDANASQAVKSEMDDNEFRKQQPDESSKEKTEIVKNSESEGKVYKQQMEDTELNGSDEETVSGNRLDSTISTETLTDEQYFEKFIPEVFLKMNHLNSVDEFISEECLDDLNFLQGAFWLGTFAQQSKVGDELTSLGVAELFQKIWKKYFEVDFLSKDNKPMNAIMKGILSVIWNYTDKSHALCEKVYRIGLYDPILSYLSSTYLDPSKTSQPDFKKIVNGLMGILQNMLQTVPDSRQALREKKAIDILQRFRSSPNEMVACTALIIQGYVITEEDNERVISDETTFQFLKKILDDALQYPDHCSRIGLPDYRFRAIEIIEALNRLAVNDNNKKRIVSAGLLPLYVKMLQPQNLTAEQAAAAEGIYRLAFKCEKELKKEPGCIQALQNLVDTSTDEVVVTQAKGALWELKQPKNDSRASKEMSNSTALGGAGGGAGNGNHIFISYQWDNQEVIMKLSDSLKRAGYNVWVDLDNMRGSILEAMAEAVENAVVVIVCVTEKYKESNNCRSEAEYSYNLHKNIIPLRLQPGYKPDGWLGILQGVKLYYDFSSEDKFNRSFNDLTKVLGHKGKASLAGTDIPDGQEVATTSKANVLRSEIPSAVFNFGNWSADDVKTWLKDNGMENFQNWLYEVDGSLLAEYKFMRQDAPETFFSMLEKKDFSLRDILRLTKALNQL